MRSYSRIILLCIMFGWPMLGAAQQSDTLEVTLPEITVDAVRETETTATAPFALSVDVREPEELAYEPALSLDAVLRPIPGVWVNDRGHFALGERISVRGMGARAAFGVRGVQVLLDGIPLTMPDGQAVLEVVEPSVLRRIEMLRSPASLFWGNGSGGVLFLSSGARPAAPTLRARILAGEYGQRHALVEGATRIGKHDVQGWASSVSQEGFREYSEGYRTRGGMLGRFQVGTRTELRTAAAAVYQDTENPSSLTREQMASNRRQARADYVGVAGKQSFQGQAGASLDHEAGVGTFNATLYGIRRLLDNPLPFAYIDVDRAAGGFRTSLREESGRLQWGIGADAAIQHDIRKNFNNVQGDAGDEIDLDQIEDVTATGTFVYGRTEIAPRLHATAGLRYSRVHFKMEDRLLSDGDESGSRLFSAWSPSLGLTYQLGGALLFGNYGTAFETPTTTELVNRPDMTGGFNPQIESQVSRGLEAGVRAAASSTIFIDVAAFRMNVDGRLVSFTNELGREFFRNAGENTHQGIEVGLEWLPARDVELQVSYTGSRYTFDDEELSGNLLPGVPEHRLFGGLQAERAGFWGRLELEAVSEYFVDDQNTAVNPSYTVVDVSAGHEGLTLGTARMRPFVSVKNVLDAQYSGSVVVNAFGGRYYEPSPGRALLAGIELSL